MLLLFLLLVQDRLEAPGQQRLYLCDLSGRRQMFEEVIQIRIRRDAIDAARHHEGEEVRARLGAARVVAEEPGFSSGRKMFDLLFAVVVVCALSKVHKFSGCNPHPATLAPAGSTWSGPGGDKWPEALQENPSVRREAQRAGRNGSEHRAGLENIDAEADSP